MSNEAAERLHLRLPRLLSDGADAREVLDAALAYARQAEHKATVERIRAALLDEDEIAHGEAWNDKRQEGMGACAYCDGEWPCRTQQGIDRLLAVLAAEAAR